MLKNPFIATALLFFTISLSSCGPSSKEKSVGSVNDRPILMKDFKKEIALISRRDPTFRGNPKALEDQLGRIIDRRLMIQEAVERGMTQDENFIETIKVFWEQTLIRQLIDAKTKEWSGRLAVSDAEAMAYYGRMNYRLTFKLAKAPSLERAGEAARFMAAGTGNGRYEVIGPVLFEDMPSAGPLEGAQPPEGAEPLQGIVNIVFDLSPGEIRYFKDEDGYSVVQVIKKEKTARPPYEKVAGRIKKAVFERKKDEALQEWLRGMRRAARIKIDLGALNRIDDEK
ncbi:MAG: peptidyl-prolyl cis-trans isomerase [Deltaproteobacteria bacterium]|nr:peptidyl-prolyl cis-trans isomerase [Deltaproteobacteria bacterium]